MEDILASIKKVIAEEKELRVPPPAHGAADDEGLPEGSSKPDDVLELDQPLTPPTDMRPPPMDLGPPLINEQAAGKSRQALEQLQTVAATVPPPQSGNPLEEMVREMLRPMLKAWLDENLPPLIDEHVKREISRITGRPL